MLLSCSENLNIYLIDQITSQKPIPSFTTQNKASFLATINHNSKLIVCVSEDGLIKFLGANLNLIQSFTDNDIYGSQITSINFSSDSKCIAYAAKNGFFKIYDLSDEQFILNGRIPQANNDYVVEILFNQDNTKLILCTFKGDIFVYAAPSYREIKFKMQLQMMVTSMKLAPFLVDTIGVTTEDGKLLIIDLSEGAIKANFQGYHIGTVTGLSFSPVSKVFLCSCGLDGKAVFYDIEKKKLVTSIETNAPLTSVSFHHDGAQLLLGDADGRILLYNIRETSSPKFILSGNKGRINCIVVNKVNTRHLSSSGINNQSVSNKQSNINNKSDLNLTGSLNSANHYQGNQSMKINENTNAKTRIKTIPTSDNNNSKALKQSELSSNRNTLNDNKQNEINPPFQLYDKHLNNSSGNIAKRGSFFNKSQKAISSFPDNNNVTENQLLSNNNINNFHPKHSTKETKNNFGSLRDISSNINPEVREYIDTTIENHMNNFKQFVHEAINTLHVDMIRQFQIHQTEMINAIRECSNLNAEMSQEIERLKKENESLKSKFF